MNTQVISFNCVLKNLAGKIISSTYNHEVINMTNNDQAMLQGLVQGLENIKPGEKRSITLSAQEAYGFYDPQKIILYPRKKLPKNLQIGASVTIVGKSGQLRTYRIIEFHSDMASLDGNHPLAGQDLVFDVEAVAVRSATREEIDEALNVVGTQLLH